MKRPTTDEIVACYRRFIPNSVMDCDEPETGNAASVRWLMTERARIWQMFDVHGHLDSEIEAYRKSYKVQS